MKNFSILVQRENFTDLDGDLFAPESLLMNNNRIVNIFNNFDNNKIIGIGKLRYVEGSGLYADCKVLDKEFKEDSYITIGFKVNVKRLKFINIEITSLVSTTTPCDETLPKMSDAIKSS